MLIKVLLHGSIFGVCCREINYVVIWELTGLGVQGEGGLTWRWLM